MALRTTKLFTLRPLRGLGLHKNAVGASPLCAFLFRHIFWCAGIASQFLYRAQKNVVNSQTLCNILYAKIFLKKWH